MTQRLLRHGYNECTRIVRRNARNFYYAFLALPKERRRAIHAVYAFCRLVDDAADEPGPEETKYQKLAHYRRLFDEAIKGQYGTPLFAAVGDTVQRFEIPPHLFHELIDGVTLDLSVRRYPDFAALSRYCYLVASTVGLMCLPIFGSTDPRAQKHGIDLGLAMQITNILRDIGEDAARDRIYIPQADLKRHGYTEEELKAGIVNGAFRSLVRQQIERARSLYESGYKLLQYVPKKTRACPKLMHDVYKSILDKIEEADYDVFSQRIGPTPLEKWRMVANLWKHTVLSKA